MRDPFQFIEWRWTQGMPYKTAMELVDPKCLPRLREALEDPARASKWSRIAVLIGYLGDDAESARAILAYVRRAEDWRSLKQNQMFSRLITKVQCLQWAGKMGDKGVAAVLRQALTPEGAAALIKDWSAGPLPEWAKQGDNLISTVRTSAAMGLVLGQDPEGIRLVEGLYA
ncbi:MAG: hypothetical protein NT031_19095, partial [Planctomycetota bacterium]|nr:hypothetical protein [Planctomycetota bacterium]